MNQIRKKITKSSLIISLLLLVSYSYADLPELTQLIKDNSPAVVKISTLQEAPRRNSYSDQIENLPPFFREFFERQNPRRRSDPQTPEPNNRLRPSGLGSGFIVSEDGYILTNNHVIDKADEIIVLLDDRTEFEAKVVGKDPNSDLALLKVDGNNFPSVKFADSNQLEVGNWVVAIGSPFGMDYSASAGIVSAIGRSLPSENGSNYVPFIQTDVAINPGNSGGPLFDLNGRVVGINSQIYTRSGGFMGLSFAIPSNVAVDVIKQLKENGKVQRGYLGVIIQDVNKDLAESFGLDKPTGALINQVIEDSPADKSGIQPGDIILSVDNKTIEFSYDLPHIIGLVPPGNVVKAELMRKGKRKTITIKVGSLGDDSNIASNYDNSIAEKLGIEVADISERDSRRLRVRGGVEVLNVEPNSPAADLGLAEGDIIVQLGFNEIINVEDLNDFIDNIPSGEKIPIRFFRRNSSYFFTIRVR